jgi:hypothetical protein
MLPHVKQETSRGQGAERGDDSSTCGQAAVLARAFCAESAGFASRSVSARDVRSITSRSGAPARSQDVIDRPQLPQVTSQPPRARHFPYSDESHAAGRGLEGLSSATSELGPR